MAGPAPSLFGLAPNGVCRACRITAASGGLLLHRFTLTACAAVCFLWRCPRVAPPGRYPASCPAEPGLSSPSLAACSDDPSRSRRKIQSIFNLKPLRVSNHTACRFAEKTRFFRSLWAGRRCAAASRSPFSKAKRSINSNTHERIRAAPSRIPLKKRVGGRMGHGGRKRPLRTRGAFPRRTI